MHTIIYIYFAHLHMAQDIKTAFRKGNFLQVDIGNWKLVFKKFKVE